MLKTMSLLAALAALLWPRPSDASEMVYRPVNPSFGGNPFNGNNLQFTPTSQRQFNAPQRTTKRDPLDDFATTVTSRLLSKISSDIADRIYGENAEDHGSLQLGDTSVVFQRVGDNVQLVIKDASTGGETTVEIPAYSLETSNNAP